jgi:hypothetical protein
VDATKDLPKTAELPMPMATAWTARMGSAWNPGSPAAMSATASSAIAV